MRVCVYVTLEIENNHMLCLCSLLLSSTYTLSFSRLCQHHIRFDLWVEKTKTREKKKEKHRWDLFWHQTKAVTLTILFYLRAFGEVIFTQTNLCAVHINVFLVEFFLFYFYSCTILGVYLRCIAICVCIYCVSFSIFRLHTKKITLQPIFLQLSNCTNNIFSVKTLQQKK